MFFCFITTMFFHCYYKIKFEVEYKQLGFIFFLMLLWRTNKFYDHCSLQKEHSKEYQMVRLLANKFNVVNTTLSH